MLLVREASRPWKNVLEYFMFRLLPQGCSARGANLMWKKCWERGLEGGGARGGGGGCPFEGVRISPPTPLEFAHVPAERALLLQASDAFHSE